MIKTLVIVLLFLFSGYAQENENQKNITLKQIINQMEELAKNNTQIKSINYSLGLTYLYGSKKDGIKQDYEKAHKFFLKDKDNLALANYFIGLMYYRGFLKDDKQLSNALYWLKRAEEKKYMDSPGVSPVMTQMIASIYLNDLHNAKEAFPYILKSAQLYKNATSQMILAFMYLRGDGVKKNIEEANKWINIAYKNEKLSKIEKKYIEAYVEKVK